MLQAKTFSAKIVASSPDLELTTQATISSLWKKYKGTSESLVYAKKDEMTPSRSYNRYGPGYFTEIV